MKELGRTIAGVVIAAVASGGCGTLTGRTFSQYFDDAKTTTKVKTRLATEQIGSLTRTNVDTYNGVVYLNGIVDTPTQKERLERVAGLHEHRLVSHLKLRDEGTGVARSAETSAAASPSTEATSARAAHLATITGEVTSVDRSAGKLSLKTDDGTLDVHVPESSLQNVREGDRVSVSLATQPAATNASKDQPRRK